MYSFFAGPSSAFLHQLQGPMLGRESLEPESSLEDGKGAAITVGLPQIIRQGLGPTEPVHRRDALPSRVQATAVRTSSS